MKKFQMLSLLAGMAMTALSCGCSSMGPITRAQSPEEELSMPVQAMTSTHQSHLQTPHSAAVHQGIQEIEQAYLDHSAVKTSFHHNTIQTGPGGYCPQDGGYCPQQNYCPQGGACPQGGMCPAGLCRGGTCGHCQGFGNGLDWYPKHHASFSYSRPSDLVYPPANQPGGFLQYPYYTHRGPSDFFRK